jgi:hypothetical protein
MGHSGGRIVHRTKYECGECHEVFATDEDLIAHMKDVHGVDYEELDQKHEPEN